MVTFENKQELYIICGIIGERCVFYHLSGCHHDNLADELAFTFFSMNSILILSIFRFFLYITVSKHNTVFIFMRDVSAGD